MPHRKCAPIKWGISTDACKECHLSGCRMCKMLRMHNRRTGKSHGRTHLFFGPKTQKQAGLVSTPESRSSEIELLKAQLLETERRLNKQAAQFAEHEMRIHQQILEEIEAFSAEVYERMNRIEDEIYERLLNDLDEMIN
uniref:B box-type domain-containing protein n=1 Tax=Globodera rostochiensis TaxID=31243 RepID=A0A914I395_GLORO